VAENKTKPGDASVANFIERIADEKSRLDAHALVALIERATGEKAKMWGASIIGFGSYHYVYDSGREGDMPVVGFSPRKAALVLYGLQGFSGAEAMLAKLGKHSTGKGCVYVKRLSDIDQDVLRSMIREVVATKRKQ